MFPAASSASSGAFPARSGRVTSWGSVAARALAVGARGRVLAVFERSFYLESDAGNLACLGDAAIGHGPLNALLDRPDPRRISTLRTGDLFEVKYTRVRGFQAKEILVDGSSLDGASVDGSSVDGVFEDGACLCLPRHEIMLHGAALWTPPPWPRVPDHDVLGRHLAGVFTTIHGQGITLPEDGLVRLMTTNSSEMARTEMDPSASDLEKKNLILKRARPAVAALERWLQEALPGAPSPGKNPDPPPEEAVRSLLGLGPGLTPSGDDLLGGALLALHALQGTASSEVVSGGVACRTVLAEAVLVKAALADAVLQDAGECTTPISVAHLQAAAGGEGADAVHGAIRALLGDPAFPVPFPSEPAPWRALDRLGHTSGWDALAGAMLVLRCYAQAGS